MRKLGMTLVPAIEWAAANLSQIPRLNRKIYRGIFVGERANAQFCSASKAGQDREQLCHRTQDLTQPPAAKVRPKAQTIDSSNNVALKPEGN
jgi:hypothetical protein